MGRSGEGKGWGGLDRWRDSGRLVPGIRLKSGWAEEVETAEAEMGPCVNDEKKSVCFGLRSFLPYLWMLY